MLENQKVSPKTRRGSIKSTKTKIRRRIESIRSTSTVIRIEVRIKTKTRIRRRIKAGIMIQVLIRQRNTTKRLGNYLDSDLTNYNIKQRGNTEKVGAFHYPCYGTISIRDMDEQIVNKSISKQ